MAYYYSQKIFYIAINRSSGFATIYVKAFGGATVKVQLQNNDREIVNLILQDYLDKIFAFALKRTFNKDDAEDLAQDIVLEIVTSALTLKNEEALKGWVWAVARNTYMRWLRKRKNQPVEYIEAQGVFYAEYSDYCTEQNLIDAEELNLLRREIGLLSKTYREIVIFYYLKDKGCAEIAMLMNISESMVKYYLFKARKILKEGISMVRNLGEKSYDPGEFGFGFWGEFGGEYFKLFKRKLPGSLLFVCYDEPLTIEELSVETGVPVVYLEDEVRVLLDYDLMEEVKNNKFQTSFVIIKKDLCNRIDSILSERVKVLAEKINPSLTMNEKLIRETGFTGSKFEWSKLLWVLVPLIMNHALIDSLQPEIMPPLPLLKTGIHGWPNATERSYQPWSWGAYNIFDENRNRLFNIDFHILQRRNVELLNEANAGMLSKLAGYGRLVDELNNEEKSAYAGLIENGFAKKTDDVVTSEVLIFTNEQYEKLKIVLKNQIDFVYEEGKGLLFEVEGILKEGVPNRLKDQVRPQAYIASLGIIGHVMESLERNGYITIPEGENRNSIANFIILK